MKFTLNPEYLHYEKEFKELLQNFDASGSQFGNSRRNELKTFSVDGKKLLIKSFKVPNLINKFAYKYLRKSKAKRSFENANYLKEHQLGTPAPMAYAEQESVLFGRSYYICEKLDYDLTIRELIHDQEYPDREKIIRAFTRFSFRMHENKVNFLDHSPGNSLIVNTGDSYVVYLVDLNRMEFKEMSFDDRMKNFHRITPLKEMAVIIANEYAKLIPQTEEEVFQKLWGYICEFQEKAARKKRIKKRLGF